MTHPEPANESTDNLLDAVFALMGEGQDIFAENVVTSANSDPSNRRPAPRPWVLCVDDDRDFAALLARRLESKGIGILNAYDGVEGVKQAYGGPANAVILDYNMPNGQGDYVLRRLKEHRMTQDIPVIVLTGNKNDAVRRTMLSLGADAFFHKPLSFDQLLAELEKHIDIPNMTEKAPPVLAVN